ncbi:MAG TPA: 2'-5' RNA ligase family protein [Gemmatimonadaceae bacterium]
MKRGYFIVAELTGASRDAVLDVQRWADPKLAKDTTPHITLVGSSGVGPIPPDTPVEDIRDALATVAEASAPISMHFGRPMRFMQTDIMVLPLDPHGDLRALHERIATSGLRFARARFSFSPHCTLNFFTTLTPDVERRLRSVRVADPVVIERIQCYLTVEPVGGRRVLDLALGAD